MRRWFGSDVALRLIRRMRRLSARTLFMRLVHAAENNRISDLLLMLFYSSKQVAAITITAQFLTV
jgi:hypothetical protein